MPRACSTPTRNVLEPAPARPVAPMAAKPSEEAGNPKLAQDKGRSLASRSRSAIGTRAQRGSSGRPAPSKNRTQWLP